MSTSSVLVTWGSKRGGTEGIARILADALRDRGVDVVAVPAGEAGPLERFDAVVVGGALYANRWHRAARRFVNRNVKALRQIPTWFFSSGPLDDSADRDDIPPPAQVAVLMGRVGACGHLTFGGRLEADAKGFPARAMAKTNAGDWRNPARIQAWAAELADALPTARPHPAADPAGRSLLRWAAHALAAWALGAVATIALHVAVTPLVYAAIAWSYFRPRGTRDPLPTALFFVGTVAALDLAFPVAAVGLWWRAPLLFAFTWGAGLVASTMPWPKVNPRQAPGAPRRAHT